jgi:hypothetical protein
MVPYTVSGWQERIRLNQTFLEEDLEDLEEVVDHMFEEEVISLGDHDLILLKLDTNTRGRANAMFIKTLLQSPKPFTYHVFYQALDRTGQTNIVEQLQSTDIAMASPGAL